ncbi:hypothetical protein AWM75_01110 [Aerococcus urinaehominis]|uniref:Uncharacterized protein n=1 Tax=Aerococcus urinaehominis TaxID=128944 RepID=A0A0X8FL79_9LACT|nr:class I SAM-dependent methyltransferase [Aerococcus urinaehominis]AMB98677.1 hypothetical protein AWM75_01110 [Aerococcus urinaehominis]SDL98251.1 hypothetical protein SAMN04487985_10383 [Aerococcus urinaehominis]
MQALNHFMVNRHWDKRLGIDTRGYIDLPKKHQDLGTRTESTDYLVLEEIFTSYQPGANSHLVDFGCGKGRVLFYIHYKFGIPATGIEINPITLDALAGNLVGYQRKMGGQLAIDYFAGDGREYQIKSQQNLFYFFNPFSLPVFQRVLFNIQTSYWQSPRPIDMLVYYPLEEIQDWLNQQDWLMIKDIINLKTGSDPEDYVVIYQFV